MDEYIDFNLTNDQSVKDSIIINYSCHNSNLVCDNNTLSLISAEDIVIYPNSCEYVNTSVTLYLTDKYSGILCNRKIQAENRILMPAGLEILNGVCSNIRVLLYNMSSNQYKIKANYTKIANIHIIKGLAFNKEIILQKDD